MLQEIRHALRLLARNLGFTAIAALSLALGIGANSAIFSLADALLLRPLPVLDPGSLVTVSTDRPNLSEGIGGVSYPDYRDFRESSQSFAGLAALQLSAFGVAKSARETPQLRVGVMVSDNFYQVMGIRPVLGRGFLPDEGQVPGRNPVVILAYDFWRTELATLWNSLKPLHSEADRNRVVGVRTELQARVQSSPPDAYLIGMLMALVAVVLIIACANVANLQLGRARARTREVAIRIALGISRTRLVRQLLIESLLLALLGGIAGLAFAYGGIRFLQTIRIPTDIPVVISPQLDHRVLLFSLFSAIASALIFGLVPALQTSKSDLVPALKSAEPGAAVRRRMLGRNVLVIGQVA